MISEVLTHEIDLNAKERADLEFVYFVFRRLKRFWNTLARYVEVHERLVVPFVVSVNGSCAALHTAPGCNAPDLLLATEELVERLWEEFPDDPRLLEDDQARRVQLRNEVLRKLRHLQDAAKNFRAGIFCSNAMVALEVVRHIAEVDKDVHTLKALSELPSEKKYAEYVASWAAGLLHGVPREFHTSPAGVCVPSERFPSDLVPLALDFVVRGTLHPTLVAWGMMATLVPNTSRMIESFFKNLKSFHHLSSTALVNASLALRTDISNLPGAFAEAPRERVIRLLIEAQRVADSFDQMEADADAREKLTQIRSLMSDRDDRTAYRRNVMKRRLPESGMPTSEVGEVGKVASSADAPLLKRRAKMVPHDVFPQHEWRYPHIKVGVWIASVVKDGSKLRDWYREGVVLTTFWRDGDEACLVDFGINVWRDSGSGGVEIFCKHMKPAIFGGEYDCYPWYNEDDVDFQPV